jgi:hypothetical protein
MEYFHNIDMGQIVGLIFSAFGLAFLLISAFAVLNSLRARKWTMTIGRIIHSEVYVSKDEDDSADTYRPDIVFEYSVFGEKFICDRLYFGVKIMTSGNLRNSQKFVRKYAVNKEVAVYYNPDNPKQSVIEPGIHFVLGSIFVMSILLITMGASLFFRIDFLSGFFD